MDIASYPVSRFGRTVLIGMSQGIRMRLANLGDGQWVEGFDSVDEVRDALEQICSAEIDKALSYLQDDEE